MPQISANGIQLEYEDFCEQVADRGHYVVRYDNRDVGLSTKFEEHGTPDLISMMLKPDEAPAPAYTLDDMADDAAGLIDALELQSAHVVGASMGGMIVQTLAIRHRAKVRSMTSIMSSTGNKELPAADPAVTGRLMMPPAQSREEAIERTVENFKVIGSPGFDFDEQALRDRAARSYDRCFMPSGQARQMAAIVGQPNRVPELQKLEVPTLVVHGAADPLVPVEGGHDTANAIPGAELWLVEGMGHDLPKAIHAELADRISKLAGRADA
jgi:pimeloyl-ACP methyl ester carboxylesterase